MKVAVIGSTGVVGNVMLSLLESRNFPLSDLIPVASERSVGKKILFKEKHYNIVTIEDAIKMKPDIACLLYTAPSPRDQRGSRMPSSA